MSLHFMKKSSDNQSPTIMINIPTESELIVSMRVNIT